MGNVSFSKLQEETFEFSLLQNNLSVIYAWFFTICQWGNDVFPAPEVRANAIYYKIEYSDAAALLVENQSI